MNKSFYGTLFTIFLVVIALMICGYVVIVKKVVNRIRRFISNNDVFEDDEGTRKEEEMQEDHPKTVQIKECSELTVQPSTGTKAQSEVITHDI